MSQSPDIQNQARATSEAAGPSGEVLRRNPIARITYPALLTGLALFTGLIVYEGAGEIVSAISIAGWGLLVVAAYHLVPVSVAAIGWHRLLPAKVRLPLRTVLFARWIGEAVNDLLPVAGIGGNVVRAHVIIRRGIPGALAGASVVVDVTLVFMAQLLFTLLGLGLYIVYAGFGPTSFRAMGWVIVMGLMAAGLWIAQRRGFFGGLARVLERSVGGDFQTLTGGAAALDAAVVDLYRDRRATLVSFVWHFVQWLVGSVEVWLALYFLGHPVGILEALLLESLAQAVRTAAFVVPAGLGVQEGGFLALGASLGIPPQIALALSLAKRVPEILLGLPGLIAWQLDLSREQASGGTGVVTYRPHPVVRVANRLARPIETLVRFDADDLLEAAARRTRLYDFGDASFREPLEILLRCYDGEARLTPIGRMAARIDVLRLLETRLWVEEWRKRYPEVGTQPIERPIFIVSLARAGTTLLHRLLAVDPANRTPLSWELMFPFPPPERETYWTDRRIAKAESQLQVFQRWLSPNIRAIHELGAQLPEECLILMAPSFRSFQFPSMFYLPTYQRWLESNDLAPGYAYHRRMLEHLQWRCRGERWILKAPAHMFGIDQIFATYPDAGIIHMHRDPVEVTASLASLTMAVYGAFSDDVDPRVVGRELADSLHSGLERYLRARDGGAPPERFLDLDYHELMADPLGTVERIYAHFGMALSTEAEALMERYLAEHPKDKHGRHEYSIARYGLDRGEEARHYRGYAERFGL